MPGDGGDGGGDDVVLCPGGRVPDEAGDCGCPPRSFENLLGECDCENGSQFDPFSGSCECEADIYVPEDFTALYPDGLCLTCDEAESLFWVLYDSVEATLPAVNSACAALELCADICDEDPYPNCCSAEVAAFTEAFAEFSEELGQLYSAYLLMVQSRCPDPGLEQALTGLVERVCRTE